MDIPQVLSVLRPGEDWGPCANTSNTYTELAANWVSEKNFCPTEAQMLTTWAEIEADRPVREAMERIQSAGMALLMGATPSEIATRAAVAMIFTRINDLAEGFAAQLSILYSRINQTPASAEELVAEIARIRAAGYDPVVPSPATVADESQRRLQDPELVTLITQMLMSGAGNPRT
jgi:hypothetical protein